MSIWRKQKLHIRQQTIREKVEAASIVVVVVVEGFIPVMVTDGTQKKDDI